MELLLKEESASSSVNTGLQAELERRAAEGVLDIKCHVDVTATTDPETFKRALLNVYEQESGGEVVSVSLGDLTNFDQLSALLS